MLRVTRQGSTAIRFMEFTHVDNDNFVYGKRKRKLGPLYIVFIYVSMYLCIYASMHLCIYASVHLCIYVSIGELVLQLSD